MTQSPVWTIPFKSGGPCTAFSWGLPVHYLDYRGTFENVICTGKMLYNQLKRPRLKARPPPMCKAEGGGRALVSVIKTSISFKKVVKVGQDNLSHKLLQSSFWMSLHFRFLKLSLITLPCKFWQLLSNLVTILRRQSQNMAKPISVSSKDLNIKDQDDLKEKHNCNQCNY